MCQMGGTHRTGSFLGEVRGEMLQHLGHVGGHVTLLLYVLVVPLHRIAIGHGASECHRLPVVAVAGQQGLGCGGQPRACLRRGDQCHHHAGIAPTGFGEE